MDPKEKALELVQKYFKSNHQPYGFKDAKQCALIAVDEILNVIIGSYDYELENNYWQEVKKEIEKL
jgi:ribosome biogenesis GTPase A